MRNQEFLEPIKFTNVACSHIFLSLTGILNRYYDSHPDFKDYLNKIKLLLDDFPEEQIKLFFELKCHTNLLMAYFNFFRKQYNYQFEPEEVVDYLYRCYEAKEKFLTHEYKVRKFRTDINRSTFDGRNRTLLIYEVEPFDIGNKRIEREWFSFTVTLENGTPRYYIKINAKSCVIEDAFILFGKEYIFEFDHKLHDTVEGFIVDSSKRTLINHGIIINVAQSFHYQSRVLECIKITGNINQNDIYDMIV